MPFSVTVVTRLTVATVQTVVVVVEKVTGLPEPPPVAEIVKAESFANLFESGAKVIV